MTEPNAIIPKYYLIKAVFLFVTVRKTFFITATSTYPTKYAIANSAETCWSDSVAYFIARVLPNAIFNMPMFVYSGSSGVLLTDQRNDKAYGNLIDHFYVSSTNHSGTAAVPYLTQAYVKSSRDSTVGSSNATVFFVEKFENIDGELFWI